MPVRIAMWSGPRNISTAMMRAWGNRDDTYVTDEPLYAHYLLNAPVEHPGAEEVIASQEGDWRKVAAWLTGPIPRGKQVWYQKHMAHHLLPDIERDWLDGLTHCFLIRDPREMLLSYSRNIPNPTLADMGLAQQVGIFEHVFERTGKVPPVLDARDVLEDPSRMLGLLCDAVGVPFEDSMLSWPPGARETDGVWAKHWYASVETSAGFQPYRARTEPLPAALEGLHHQCREYYEELYRHRIGG